MAFFSTAGALRIGAVREPSIHPLIACEHLSLYIQKHLGHSVAVCAVAVCGKVDRGRPRQSQVVGDYLVTTWQPLGDHLLTTW